MQYANLNAFIFAAINIDNNWYERILKNRFEKSMRDKTDIYHDELIRRRKDYYWKKQNHDNKIVFIKIDFIEYRKKKNLKDEQEKTFKNNKKYYNYNKKDHFARDYRSKNKKNRQQINVLIKVSDKTETQKEESEINTSEVSINDKYCRIENVDKLQKVLNDIASDKALASTQKINDTIRQTFNKSKTLYLYKNRSNSNDKYEWNEEFQKQ